METHIRAFFYDYKYYLFPEDCETIADLKGRTHVRVKRLKEERCMAPDFIYESIADEELEIEAPERIFEVSVNLYTAAEYDELLEKQVKRVCPGCSRYIPDDDPRSSPDLEGHHREISLDGVCYEREQKEDPWDFSTCIDYFWHRIAGKVNELGAYIDKKNMKKFNEVLNKELGHFFYSVRFWGGVKDGKYYLGFAPDCHHSTTFRLLLAFIAHGADNEECAMKAAGWEVRGYREKGAFQYTGKTKMKKCLARLSPSPNPNAYLVTIYSKHPEKEKPEGKLCSDIYDYLCATLGEEIVSATTFMYEFSKDKEGMKSIEEIAHALEERYVQFLMQADFGNPYPVAVGYSASHDDNAPQLPYREKILEGTTCCPEISFLPKENAKEAWWLDFVSFCYLYVPRPIEEALAPLSWYLANANLIPEPYRNPDDTRATGGSVGAAACEDGFIIDNYIASEQKFFRTLRALAPVLSAYNVKLVVVNREGVMTYRCGYEFTPID